MANTRKKVRRRKWNKNDEEMGQKLPSICCRRRTNSKSKWRRLLLQSQRCNQNRSSEVGYQQYWAFVKHVSIL